MLKDAEHFKLKIGGLDGAGNAGEYIIGLIKDKKVPKLTKSGVDTVTTANDEATPSINGTGTEVANGADRDESKKSSDGTNGNAIKA
jgi:vacuolar protein sorting-associated protein 54